MTDRPDQIRVALALDEPTDGQDPRPPGRLGDHVTPWREQPRINARRDQFNLCGVDAQSRQFPDLVRGFRDNSIGSLADESLGTDPYRWRRVCRALVTPLHRAERVIRLDQRDGQLPVRIERRDPAHPEVRMHDIGHPACPIPRLDKPLTKAVVYG